MNISQHLDSKKIKRLVVIFVVLLVSIGILLWVQSRAFIAIDVINPISDRATYRLVNQKTGSVEEFTGNATGVKRLVSKGQYEVLVKQDDSSYFKSVQTGSFFSTVKVNASLVAEVKRSFVGSNPQPCMNYSQDILLSYGCDGGSTETAKAHLPADEKTPSIVEPLKLPSASIGGTASLENNDYLLLNGLLENQERGAPSVLYLLDKNLQLNKWVPPKGIPFDENLRSYSAAEYQQGILLYNLAAHDIKYYKGTTSEPQSINIPSPADGKLQPFGLSTNESYIAVGFSTVSEGREEHSDKSRYEDLSEVEEGKSIFVIYTPSGTKQYQISGSFVDFSLCGEKLLCVQNGPVLTVYEVGPDKLSEKFTIKDVWTYKNKGPEIAIVRDKEVLGINAATGVGNILYSFGNYTFCGFSVAKSGYLLCVADSSGARYALSLDTSNKNEDNIDKKVLELLKQPFIEAVSPYQSWIYVALDLGEPVYDPSTKSYGYNKSVKDSTSSQLNSFIKSLDLDLSKYKIINTSF